MKKRNSSEIKIGFPKFFCKKAIISPQKKPRKITTNDISIFLQKNNLKVTKSRLELIKLFLSSDNHNLTTGLILSKLRKINPKVNFSSVYNNLDTFTKIGILRPNINVFTNQATFEIAIDVVPHVHAYDINQQKQLVFEVDCGLHAAIVQLFANQGLEIEDYLIQAIVSKKENSSNSNAVCSQCPDHKIELKEFPRDVKEE